MNLVEEALKFERNKRVEAGKCRQNDNAVNALMCLKDDLCAYLAGLKPLHAERMLLTVKAGLL